MCTARKIVFLDIDGTLVNRVNHIPWSARKACRKARKNGHLLYIATGRAKGQIAPSILALGFDGVISSAGAHIEDDGQLVFQAFFPRLLLERLLSYFNTRKTGYLLEMPDKVVTGPYIHSFFENRDGGSNQFLSGLISRLFSQSLSRFLQSHSVPYEKGFDTEKVCKLVFMESESVHFEQLRQAFGGECELFRNSMPFSAKGGGEITPLGVHKGAALEQILRRRGVCREDSIAIGDGDNDRPMIEYAGTGIAMGNSGESLKKAADYVTGSPGQRGLAKAFKKYGLV